MHGEYHPDVVLAYNGIAGLLMRQNRPDDAIQMFDRAIEICNRLEQLGELDAIIFGKTLNNKASILMEQSNLEAATEILNKALMIKMNATTAAIYENLEHAYFGQHMIEDAIRWFSKAINLYRKQIGNNHPHTKELVHLLEVV